MNTLIQANIFFFITSIVVVIIGAALVVALIYLIQILRDVRYVSKRVREQSDRVLSDVEDLRNFIKKEGKRAINIKELVGGVIGTFLHRRKTPRNKKRKER